jgi:hypothetical protein
LNRYSFVRNNPLKYVDPSGHCFTLNAFGLSISLFCKGQEGNQPTIFDGDPDSFGGENDLTIYDGPGSFGNDDGVQILDGDPESFGDGSGSFTIDGDPNSFGNGGGATTIDGDPNSFGIGQKGSTIFSAQASDDEVESPILSNITRLPNDQMDPPGARGNAPISKKDGHEIEIHHMGQKRLGPFQEIHRIDHRGKGIFGILHDLTKQSEIDRDEFRRWKQEYWEDEWDSGRWT